MDLTVSDSRDDSISIYRDDALNGVALLQCLEICSDVRDVDIHAQLFPPSVQSSCTAASLFIS